MIRSRHSVTVEMLIADTVAIAVWPWGLPGMLRMKLSRLSTCPTIFLALQE